MCEKVFWLCVEQICTRGLGCKSSMAVCGTTERSHLAWDRVTAGQTAIFSHYLQVDRTNRYNKLDVEIKTSKMALSV